MDNKIFKQLLREGIGAHKSGQQKSVQEVFGEMKFPSGRGRRPDSVSGDHDDEGEREIPNFKEFSASGCTQKEWETRTVTKGEDPTTIKCAKRDQDGEEKLIWGLNSTSNPDSLKSLLLKHKPLDADQIEDLIRKIIELARTGRVPQLEEQLSGDRGEKQRVFDLKATTGLLHAIASFNLNKDVGEKLLRVLDLWGRKNTVRFEPPAEKVQLWADEESVPDSREAKLAAIDKKRVKQGLDPEEIGGPIGGDDDHPEEKAVGEKLTPDEEEVINNIAAAAKDKSEEEQEDISMTYLVKKMIDSNKPEEEKKSWVQKMADKLGFAVSSGWMALPFDNIGNILNAAIAGNFAAIPGNLFLAAVPIDAYLGQATDAAGVPELKAFFDEIKRGEWRDAWDNLAKFFGPEGSAVTGVHIIRSMATVAGQQQGKINTLIKAIDIVGTILIGGAAAAASGTATVGAGAGVGAAVGAAGWKVTAGYALREFGEPFLRWLVDEFAAYGYSTEEQTQIKERGEKKTVLNGEWQAKSIGKNYTGTETEEQLFNSLYNTAEEGIFKQLNDMAAAAAKGKEGSGELGPEDEETEELTKDLATGRVSDAHIKRKETPGLRAPENMEESKTRVNEQRYKMLLERFKIK